MMPNPLDIAFAALGNDFALSLLDSELNDYGYAPELHVMRALTDQHTDSFWEGVDVPGSALECVVITRLPFRVPTEPIQEARVERLQARGRHPFMNFTLPQAVLKLKQGFGRLIRSTTDQGVVAILDRRVVTKSYGRVFLESLPDSPVRLGSLSDCVGQVESFFASRRDQSK